MAHTAKLRQIGVVYPESTEKIARREGIPLSAAVAMLFMETGGGHNVFGHDPVRRGQVQGGNVTRLRYLFYKARRRFLGNQGVGPCQLTSPGLQDAADALGGCWRPEKNMAVGFKFLHDLERQWGSWQAAFEHYNGSGPAAQAYGRRADALRHHFHSELA
jgi:hypothetical protein